MNRELRQQWLDALRSGEYPQTFGQLRRLERGLHNDVEAPAGFCCLGVLADACVKLWPEHFEWLDEGTIQYPCATDVDGYAETNGELQELGQILRVSKDETELIVRNDSHAHDFARIADYIEAHVPADDDPLPFAPLASTT